MSRLFKLQFLGPFALFATTLCAELAARALQYAPNSEFLWFINLRMFGIFQRSYAMLLNLSEVVDGFQYLGIALPIFVFVLACLGLAAKSRPPLTVATRVPGCRKLAGHLCLGRRTAVRTIRAALMAQAGGPTRGLTNRMIPRKPRLFPLFCEGMSRRKARARRALGQGTSGTA